MDIVDTLYAGETSLTFSNDIIKTTSTIQIFADIYGVYPTNVNVAQGRITLFFDPLDADLDVKVRISQSELAPADPEAGLSFRNLYEVNGAGEYEITKPGLYFVGQIYRYNQFGTINITSDNSYLNSNSNNICNYGFINLNIGDKVAFSSTTELGNVVLLKDCSFVSVTSFDKKDGARRTTTPDTNKLYFVYAGCHDDTDNTAYDHSVVGTKATSYDSHASDKTYVRIASCVGNDVTIDMYGYTYGSVAMLVAEMERG